MTEEHDILVDSREPPRIAKTLSHLNEKRKVGVVALPYGDVAIGQNEIGIERKTASDFIASLMPMKKPARPPRIWEQAKGLVNTYNTPIIVVVGNEWKSPVGLPKNKLMKMATGAITTLILKFKIPVISVYNTTEYAYLIDRFWNTLHPSKISQRIVPKSPARAPLLERVENVCCQCPGIGLAKADYLLAKKRSLKGIFSTPFEELVSYIGEKPAHNLVRMLTQEVEIKPKNKPKQRQFKGKT